MYPDSVRRIAIAFIGPRAVSASASGVHLETDPGISPRSDAVPVGPTYRDHMRSLKEVQGRLDRGIGPLGVDTAFALLVIVMCLVTVSRQELVDDLRAPEFRDYVTAALVAAPIAIRRRVPLSALGLALVVQFVHVASNAPEGSTPLAVAILLYTVAAWSSMRDTVIAFLATSGVIALLGAIGSVGLDGVNVLLSILFFGLVTASGVVVHVRRDSAEAQVRAATQRAEVEAQRAARAVAEERLRIAQELHDVVAHSISVIAVQAGVGSHFLGDDAPAEAVDALDAIGTTSRSTLNELRRILGVLRGEDGVRSHTPAPTLDDLPALVHDVSQVGLDVRLAEVGERAGEHRGIEMSAYRIVQEALTNVTKHAGTTSRVDVRVEHCPDELVVEVVDDGRGAAAAMQGGDLPSGHHGLIGMRERVDVWGGRLDAGPRPDGGFAVRAVFPYEGDR